MKKIRYFFLFLSFIHISGLNAQVISTTQKNKIEKVIDEETGKEIPQNVFYEMVKANPRILLRKVIDEYGEITCFVYNKNKQSHDTYNPRDPAMRVKKGEKFLPFVFKTIDNKSIKSDSLIGKIVILDFWLTITKLTPLARFNDLINISQLNTDIIPIILSSGSIEDSKEFVKATNINIPLIAEIHNFYERYKIIQMPTYILIDKNGNLVDYFTDIADLKKALEKL